MKTFREFYESVEYVSHHSARIPVNVNPTKTQLVVALAKSEYGELRYIKDYDDSWYFWDSNELIHREMATRLGIDINNTKELGYVTRKQFDKFYHTHYRNQYGKIAA